LVSRSFTFKGYKAVLLSITAELEDGFELISEGESVGVYLTSKDEKESWLADLEPYVDLAKGCV